MKFFRAAACLAGFACCALLQGGVLPIDHLDSKTIEAYTAYVEKFEQEYLKPFTDSGRLWMDAGGGCCGKNQGISAGKVVVEPRMTDDVAEGSIHHFSGATHVDGAKIEDMRRLMEDYPNYPKNFKPDVTKASADLQPDSTSRDDHFISHLTLTESTLWMNVQFDTAYDTHYRYIDDHRWVSRSASLSLKEQRDAKDVSKGYFPEGEDHGFLWRTGTYWFVREANGGLDLEVDSITLSRPNMAGFAWFGSRRSRDAVDKMLHDARSYLTAAQHK